MNRRKALLLTMLSGGLLPLSGRARAQDPDFGDLDDRPRKKAATKPAARNTKRVASDDLEDDPRPAKAAEEDPPTDLPTEAGQSMRTFDISRYTALGHSVTSPQNSITEWIFRRTGTAIWHGEKIAMLSAGKTQIRAYHNPRILKQVQEVIRRFTDSTADVLSIRVRFVAASDSRWRYLVYSRLKPIGSGPQGQQIWTLRTEDAAQIFTQLQGTSGYKPLAEQKISMINGQTLKVNTTDLVDYVSGPQRDSNDRLGLQPAAGQLEEGVVLRLSPLLTLDGDALDAAIDLKANTVKSLHRTKILSHREIGQTDMTIDVPEVTETHLNQTITDWPLGQTLLISAGIHPGILQNKAGFLGMRIPGTVPTSTELLVFLDVEVADPPRTARSRDRDRD